MYFYLISGNKNKRPTVRPEVPIEFSQPDFITEDRSKDPFKNPPVISADGKKPRVKSNFLLKNANSGNSGNGGAGGGSGGGRKHKEKSVKASQKVEFNEDKFRFVAPEDVVDYETDIGTFEQTLRFVEKNELGRVQKYCLYLQISPIDFESIIL